MKNSKIRIASWNVGDFSTATSSAGIGISKGNGTEETRAQYVAAIKKVNADIWGLQEDSPYFNGDDASSPYDVIYNSLPYYKRHFTGTYNGKAFLSKYEIYDVEPVKYTSALTSYAPDGTLYYGHPWFLTGNVNIDGKVINLVSLHFDWSCRERRTHQVEEVIAFAKQCEYCIIIGDFNPENYINDGPKGGIIGEINPNTKNIYQCDWAKFTEAGLEHANGGKFGVFGTLASKGKSICPYPWDNIVVTPNIKITAAEVMFEPWMDDHAIMVADVEIN